MKVKLEELAEKSSRLSRKAVSAELDKIAADDPEKMVRAEAVVDAARHPDNPMHRHFEWDDAEAADEYRLMQARQLIRWVKVKSGNDGPVVQKFFSLMNDRKKEGGGYRETATIIKNKKLCAELEATAKKELEGWLRRHAVLTDLCEKVREAAGI